MDSRIKNSLPVVVAIVLGLFAVVAVNRYVQRKTTIKQEERSQVLVAMAELAIGAVLTEKDLDVKSVPSKDISSIQISMPSGDSTQAKSEAARIRATVTGRKIVRGIAKGEPINWNDFAMAEVRTLSSKLRADRRAVTIAADDVAGVAQNIVPGDHVDILATLDPGRLGGLTGLGALASMSKGQGGGMSPAVLEGLGPTTIILMQDVTVLATGRNHTPPADAAGNERSSYSTLTLEVLPEETTLLAHARQNGALSFVLRNQQDPKSYESRLKETQLEEAKITDKTLAERVKKLDVQRSAKIIEVISGSSHSLTPTGQ